MQFMASYESSQTGPGVKLFGRKNDGLKVRRLLFDRKLVMHATNTIAGIVYEIKKATKPISLQRASTVPVGEKFGKIRMHAGVHQTVVELVKTMELMKLCNVFISKTRSKTCGLHTVKPFSPARV
jgi:hypothetical protein